jgi:hypothetical protein
VIGFPLLIVPFTIYNMVAFLTPFAWSTRLLELRLPSGLMWEPTASDAFILFSLLMLLLEFIKATKHGKSFIEHFLSFVLAGAAGAEFVMVNPNAIMGQLTSPPQMGNSTFMLFVAICAVDFFAGFAAALRRARRAVVVEEVPVVVAPAPAPVVRPEPARIVDPVTRVEPAPSPFTPRPEPVVKADPVQKIEP